MTTVVLTPGPCPGETLNWAGNPCSTRLWLHQNGDGSGNALCISPGTQANVSGHWRQFYLSTNKSKCP